MYPILFVMAIGVAIAVDRLLYLSKTTRATNKLWKLIVPMLKADDLARAHRAVGESKSPLALVLSYGFARAKPAVKREVVESAMEEGVMEVMPLLEERTHYLATLANVATLLGLLGTIIGLIDAFAVVAEADPAEKADLLSGSISVAMNTTAFGKILSVP